MGLNTWAGSLFLMSSEVPALNAPIARGRGTFFLFKKKIQEKIYRFMIPVSNGTIQYGVLVFTPRRLHREDSQKVQKDAVPASLQTRGWQVTLNSSLALTIISASISPSGISHPTSSRLAPDWFEAKMGDQQPQFSYYQIGGFRPNMFLKGCFTTFFLKI